MITSSYRYSTRLEVRFASVPDRATRRMLKDHGFWWCPVAKCWHLARPVNLRFVRNDPVTQDGFEYALRALQDYCGMTQADADRMRQARTQDRPGTVAEAEPKVHTFVFASGTFYRNAKGRCIDAPCCGCCTI